MTMLELFAAARRRSVPITVIYTADQQATVEATAAVNNALEDNVLVRWDAAQGLTALNKAGEKELARLKLTPEATQGFVEAMIAVAKLPQGAVVYAMNAQRQLTSTEPMAIAGAVQAVANLRNEFKINWRMLVLLCPAMIVPAEIEHDVVILHHELPTVDELKTVVTDLYAAGKQAPIPEVVEKAADVLSGLSLFAAEQQTSLSFRASGLDLDALWERKRVTIEQTPGLSVWRGKERFADLVGMDALKAHLNRRIAAQARRPIGVIVWIDEIDKALANVEQDTSGVRMYQLLKLLTKMENNEWTGFIGVGVPGAGKSLIAKAFGNEAGVPTTALDLGATESKYVGESEANLIRVMQVIEAMGRGHAYFIATSNAATVMRPELQRRFTDGMWMFDLMTRDERGAAWTYYIKKYGLTAAADDLGFDDDAWTGAEIRNACRYAYEVECSLGEAAAMVVPMARSRAREIEGLRQFAHNRFLDVNRPGYYQYQPEAMAHHVKQVRALDLRDVAQAAVLAGMKES